VATPYVQSPSKMARGFGRRTIFGAGWGAKKSGPSDRPGIGAPGHLFKSARVATYYNVLHYITTSSHEGYCWPEKLAKRDIMCLEPLERHWTTILVTD
jgi:hypothetical protein